MAVLDCEQREKRRETKRQRGRGGGEESGDSILYFFRTRFPVTGNLGYSTPALPLSAPQTAGDRNFILFAREFGRRARLRFFRLRLAEVFHEDCGVPGRNLKWMPVSAPRYGIGDFPPFPSPPAFVLSSSLGARPFFYLPASPKFVLANYFSAGGFFPRAP